jgi:hypothetical protein
MAEVPDDEEVVDWNGILEPQERRRILARIHSAFGAVGARIPETVTVKGRTVRLKETVFSYLDKDKLTAADLEAADALSEALGETVRELSSRIQRGDLTEKGAVDLMKEVLGILRALDHLRRLRDPQRAGPARRSLMERVDDERRWLEFVKNVR